MLPDVRSLECFVVLAELRHFGRTATQLHMTQPALSVRIRRLEEMLGFALFTRGRTEVALTPRGRLFLPHARQAVETARAAGRAAAGVRRGQIGELRVGYTLLGLFAGVPEILSRYRQAYPGVQLQLTEQPNDALEAALAANALDLAFLHPPTSEPGVALRELSRAPLRAALPADWELARKPDLAVSDLEGVGLVLVSRRIGPVIHDRIIAACRRGGLEPQVVQETTTSMSVLGLVAAGVGVGFVIAPMAQLQFPGVRFREVGDVDVALPFAVAWPRDTVHPMVEAMTGLAAAHQADVLRADPKWPD